MAALFLRKRERGFARLVEAPFALYSVCLLYTSGKRNSTQRTAGTPAVLFLAPPAPQPSLFSADFCSVCDSTAAPVSYTHLPLALLRYEMGGEEADELSLGASLALSPVSYTHLCLPVLRVQNLSSSFISHGAPPYPS